MGRETDVAWASGLFEGEGCMAWTTGRWHLPRLVLAMTDRDVVERFMAIVGVGTIRCAEYPNSVKPLWKWTACSDDADMVMRLFVPYFGERRSNRAFALLLSRAFHIDRVTLPRDCGSCGREFKPRFSPNSRRQKFCSPECCERAQNERKRGVVHAGH